MTRWACGIEGDDAMFDQVEDLVVHQATAHDRVECRVCGALVPDGYLAIRHVFEEHSHGAYVRDYEASPGEAEYREEMLDVIDTEADLREIVDRLEG